MSLLVVEMVYLQYMNPGIFLCLYPVQCNDTDSGTFTGLVHIQKSPEFRR